MSFYSDASLVMIPSGYKTSKVYSAVPTSGDGDLVFSRSNDTATRVASSGLIEKVRTNLFPTGSALLSTGWTSVGATLTAGQTDPNGGTTALRVQLAAGGSPYSYIFQSFTGSAFSYARSVFIKGATAQAIRIVDPHSGAGVTVNLTTSYQRFTAIGAGTAPSFGIQFDNNTDNGARDFTIAFVQIETGDIATDYIATTTAAVSVGPVANVPRLDYLNSSCPRLLLEPQRTNSLTYSEQIDNADWLKLDVTIAANTSDTLDPAGYNGSDKITDNSTNGGHFVYRFGGWDTTQRTASVYAKAGTSSRICIVNATTNAGVFANLTTGTISVSAGFTGTITSVGNGWYRITATHTAASSQTFAIGLFTGTNTADYIGTGSYAYLWGAQLEAAAYATSYIPTLGASVTRGADAAVKTGISSLIGQTEGTIYWEGKIDGFAAAFNEAPPISLFATGADTNGAQAYITLLSNNSIRFVVYDGTTAQCSITTSSAFYTFGTTIKMAAVYKANDFALYINGVQIGTDTSGSVVAFSQLNLDYQTNVGKYSVDQVLLFKTRLSNSELASLTA